MAYEDLGLIRVLGQPDSTAGYNFNPYLPGTGWSVLINQSTPQRPECVQGQWPRQAVFEVYQASVDGPVGSSLVVMVNRQIWNWVLTGWQNYYDPQQALPLQDGSELQFAWNFAATAGPYTPSGGSNVRPVVTLWLRALKGQQ